MDRLDGNGLERVTATPVFHGGADAEGLREERAARFERRFEAPMFVAALLVIPAVALDVSSVSHGWKTAAATLNWVVWSAFAVG